MRIFSTNSDRSSIPNYVVLITKSMRKEKQTIMEASKLKMAGTHIIGIGMFLLCMFSATAALYSKMYSFGMTLVIWSF